jgi:deazaflavin-dependent oxidoreductase (nitroreductase family)
MTESIDSPGTPGNAKSTSAGSLVHTISVRTAGISRRISGSRWLPLWAVLRHVGRKSGTAYQVPIVALRSADHFLIPLPFGDRTQWLKNIQAADRSGLRLGGHDYVIDQPEVIDLAAAGPDLPGWVRFSARRFGIKRFVRVHRVGDR